jgi:translation initiation factor IF-3
VMYRGREMVHRELGRDQLKKVVDMLGPIATVENPPRMEGRFLSMILVPNREAIAEAQKQAEAEAKAAAAAESASAEGA